MTLFRGRNLMSIHLNQLDRFQIYLQRDLIPKIQKKCIVYTLRLVLALNRYFYNKIHHRKRKIEHACNKSFTTKLIKITKN